MTPFLLSCACAECWARSHFLESCLTDLFQTEAIYTTEGVWEGNPLWVPLVRSEKVNIPFAAFHLAEDLTVRSLPKEYRLPAYLGLGLVYSQLTARNSRKLGGAQLFRFSYRF